MSASFIFLSCSEFLNEFGIRLLFAGFKNTINNSIIIVNNRGINISLKQDYRIYRM